MPNPNTDSEKAGAYLLSIRDIAGWQLPEFDDLACEVVAALPALQRSAVWKARQVEALWDSLVRGFPIGSFLVTRNMGKDRGKQNLLFGENMRAGYHLLDGQQRANAIALGHFDPWRQRQGAIVPAALWVDLDPPRENDDREYYFRVVTRAHPWGYSRDREGKPLSVGQRRDAFNAYRAGRSHLANKKAYEIPLTDTWPWDAVAPVPVPFLIDAIRISNGDAALTRRHLLRRLGELPFWEGVQEWGGRWKEPLEQHLASSRLDILIERMVRTVCASKELFGVPALMLPTALGKGHEGDKGQDGQHGQDPVETLFIRVNAGGTPLQGEELIYSILKSIWPAAPGAIEKMDCRFVSPARLVILVARLILAREAWQKNSASPPPIPDVARFRRLMHNVKDPHCEGFEGKLRGFIEQDTKAARVFAIANKLLADINKNYTLPSVLASDMAQRSPDVFFLLLCWIDRMLQHDLNPLALDENTRRRILGMVTAISWFAHDASQCINVLWPALTACDVDKLSRFFSRKTMRLILSLGKYGEFQLLPAVPPELLQAAIGERITQFNSRGFGKFENPRSPFWDRWSWYDSFAERNMPTVIQDWYGLVLGSLWDNVPGPEGERFDRASKIIESWTRFVDRVYGERRLLLFAQRQWIRKWYDGHEHFRPEQIDDLERPWDYDHIHPSAFETGIHNMPPIIKKWHNSLGNLRAWPLEANRSDAAATPYQKLGEIAEIEKVYGISCLEDKMSASVIEKANLTDWQRSTPAPGVPFTANYLSHEKSACHWECRKHLILAITDRFVRIYRIWYDELQLDRLMPQI